MKVTLPRAWQDFVASQVKSGEFGDPSEVVRHALRLLRDRQEARAIEEMRVAFAGVDSQSRKNEPSAAERTLIDNLVKRHRRGNGRA